MSELTQSLKNAVTRYPGTMAELARRADIDRSTLYKIISGRRTPRQEQLDRLADALELSEEQKAALMQQYRQRGRVTDPKLRAELHKLLEGAFRVDDYAQPAGTVSNEVARGLFPAGCYAEGTRAVADCVSALVADYLLSGDTRPLLLSPFTNPVLDRVLVDRFSVATGAPVPVCQLLIFTQSSDFPRDSVPDIANLTRTLQFLFLAKMSYEARAVRSDLLEPNPGALFPVYLLLPHKALIMDRDGQHALVVTDRAAVEAMRLEFTRTYINSASVLKLATEVHDFSESMRMYGHLTATRTRCAMLRWQPLLTLYLTEDTIRRFLSPAPEVQAQLPHLLRYMEQWRQQTPDVCFSEDGLLQFVRTGRMSDLPPALYTPLDPAARREILYRLRDAAESDRQSLRIVDTGKLALTPSMCVNLYRNVGTVFCQAVLEPNGVYSREYLMEDTHLTDALFRYLDELKSGDSLRSKKYTLDFIDYCLRLL